MGREKTDKWTYREEQTSEQRQTGGLTGEKQTTDMAAHTWKSSTCGEGAVTTRSRAACYRAEECAVPEGRGGQGRGG